MKLWVATSNSHKLQEIKNILGTSFEIYSLLDLPQRPKIIEDASSYYDNALIKATTLHGLVKEPVFADDSGLEVEALDNKPGIMSARYSGSDATDATNIAKLLSEMKHTTSNNRRARFICQILYIDSCGKKHDFKGVFAGEIAQTCSGNGGFGYDPIFYLPQKGCTVSELPEQEKNKISHRALALNKLKHHIFNGK